MKAPRRSAKASANPWRSAARGAALAVAALAAPAAQARERARFDWFDYAGSNPDYAGRPRAGTYLNPILAGFYPDPNILRVGDDFYLVTSSFGYFPGLPIFRSRDLVNWTQIGNALSRPEQFPYRAGGVSFGAYAPALAYRDGLFYLINKCVVCEGNYWMTATDPAGPWSDPHRMPSIAGFDPSLFFDTDGAAYVVYSQRAAKPAYDGHTGIWVQQWDMAANTPVGAPTLLLDKGIGERAYYAEGAHLFRRDLWYYLTVAQGGTGAGHGQVILRSRSVRGPYEAFAGNPILTQAGSASPVTSTGHASFVETPRGDWWAVFLGTQPYEGDYYNTGRETFLLPVRWTADGWPTILPHGEPVPRTPPRPQLPRGAKPPVPTTGNFHIRDEFDRPTLGLRWMMLRSPQRRWWSIERGSLILDPQAEPLGSSRQPSYLAWRQQHVNARFATRVRFRPEGEEDRAGLALFQSETANFFFGIGRAGGRTVVKLERRTAAGARGLTLLASAPLDRVGPLDLRIEAAGALYRFAYKSGGQWRTLADKVDGRILSTKAAGGFVGATAGPFAYVPAPAMASAAAPAN